MLQADGAARLARHFDHAAAPFATTAAVSFLFLMVMLGRHDASFFVQAGEHFVDTSRTPANLQTVTPFTGYDGQFYYRLALTPFSREPAAFGIRLDDARYRHQRILYPLLAWGLSFGSPPLVIYSLILVNYLALCGLGWVGGLYAQLAGRHALWGLTLSLFGGFAISLARDLAEIVEALFVLTALLALARSRPMAGAASFSLAILAKETSLLAAAAWAGVAAWRDRHAMSRPVLLGALAPVLVYGVWQASLTHWWGTTLASATRNNIGWPLVGMLGGYAAAAEAVGGTQTRWLIEVAALLLLALGTAAHLRRSGAGLHVKASWALYGLLLLAASAGVWIEDYAFLRAATLFYLLSMVVLLHSRGRMAAGMLLASLCASVWFGVHFLFVR